MQFPLLCVILIKQVHSSASHALRGVALKFWSQQPVCEYLVPFSVVDSETLMFVFCQLQKIDIRVFSLGLFFWWQLYETVMLEVNYER